MIKCRKLPHLSLIYRSNHTLVSLLTNPRKALKKEKVPPKIPKKFNNDELLSKFPKELYRKTKTNTKMSRQLYLINVETASKIANHLTGLPNQNITFVETNPGPGILTDLLIQSGMTDLRLFEGREEFLSHLQDTYTKVYPDRVKLKHADLITLHKVLHTDDLSSSTQVDEILSALPVTEWQNDINFRLFGATGSTSFFKQLINSIVFQNSLLALGRCELYLAVPSAIYLTLTSSSKSGFAHYRAISILFQIFFEYQLLDKFPRTDFLPYVSSTSAKSPVVGSKPSRRATKGIKSSQFDPDTMYFVKIVPRRDLLKLCPANQIQELWHFIKLNCHSRQSRIIILLEKLIPGCGVRLLLNLGTKTPVRAVPIHEIDSCETPPTTNRSMTLSTQDYYDSLNIFTQVGDLQPSELFTLFHEFRALPEYSSCNFLPSLESILLKLGPKSDDVGTGTIKQSVGICDGIKLDDELKEKII